MKVYHIACRNFANIGGIESYLKSICPLLSDLGHDVTVFTEGETFSKSVYNNVNVVTIPTLKSKFFSKIYLGVISSFLTIYYSRFRSKGTIVHYHANASALISFIPRLLGYKTVFQGHGFEWKRAKWGKLSRFIIKIMDNFVISVNNNILMVSNEQTEYVQKKFSKNCETLTPGVNLPSTINNYRYSESKFNVESEKYILFIARLVPEKKAEVLIEAFKKASVQDLKLVIAGDDPFEKDYISSLKSISNENVIFTGIVQGEEKEWLLANCLFFCIPSELEGLPITLLEAMSYDKLCLASDIPANIEALADTGLFFKVNDSESLCSLIRKVELQYSDIVNSTPSRKTRISDKFTWEKKASQLSDFYSSL